MFTHTPVIVPKLKSAHESDKHFYEINGIKYPSITTILHSFPNKNIEIWKAKTPNWREIQEESLTVGTNLHCVIENYLKNNIENINDGVDLSLAVIVLQQAPKRFGGCLLYIIGFLFLIFFNDFIL